jgi:hypothetical protein
MKNAATYILVLLFTGGMFFLIQSSPAFALLDDNCSCINWIDAMETCDIYCDLKNTNCDGLQCLTPQGSCQGTKCFSKWKVVCDDLHWSTYWQYTDCSWQCEGTKNPPIFVMDDQEDTPDQEHKQEQENTNEKS